MSKLNYSLPGIFLYLAAIFPHSFYYKYNEFMLVIKLSFFLFFLLFAVNRILLINFLIGLLVIILALISSLLSNFEFSITRFILYSICILFFSTRFEYIQNISFFKRLYIISVLILSIFSIYDPHIINFLYGWNDIDQQKEFFFSNKYISIYGLPATASFCYGLIIFILINNLNLFKKIISIFLILFFFFLLISTKSTSSVITIIFLLIFFFKNLIKKKKFNLYSVSILILSILILFNYPFSVDFFLDLLNYDFYKKQVSTSFVNRFNDTKLLYGYYISDIFFGKGFVTSDSISFGDVGYFDNLFRLGVIGTILYYFLFFNFIKNILDNKNYITIILWISLLEFGHNYSKSIVFFPIITIILLSQKK